jgi:hypothetical protein
VSCLYNTFRTFLHKWTHKFGLFCRAHTSPPISRLTRVQSPDKSSILQHIRAMDSHQILPQVPSYVKFRVLIIGRANAGKTSILQRVCDTTENPEIYSIDSSGVRSRVRSHWVWVFPSDHIAQVQQLDSSQEVERA